ncbi:MAG: dockerin type I repeat-containing protein [Oscillospiraceae bacterium]|nr:dockerin type I repeat-containing protein [Oscillospiraceae bacterium]
MKTKKIASLACAFLLAYSACPVNVLAADTVSAEPKEDIIINGVTYSFYSSDKEQSFPYEYVPSYYEGIVDGVTYVANIDAIDGEILYNVPKDIIIDGISYSYHSGFSDSLLFYDGIVDGISHFIGIDLNSGEVVSDVMCPETFVDELTGVTYSLVGYWGCNVAKYKAVIGEYTYSCDINFLGGTCEDNITVDGTTYSVHLNRKNVTVNGINYSPCNIRFVNNFDDNELYAATYVYEVFNYNDLETIDPASILSEIDGFPVFTDPSEYDAYINAFWDECRESYFAEMGNSDIMTLEDEIEIPAVKGDATGDGEVDILDVIVANKAILGQKTLTPEQAQALDIDSNGIVDTTDSLAIMQYITGLTENL